MTQNTIQQVVKYIKIYIHGYMKNKMYIIGQSSSAHQRQFTLNSCINTQIITIALLHEHHTISPHLILSVMLCGEYYDVMEFIDIFMLYVQTIQQCYFSFGPRTVFVLYFVNSSIYIQSNVSILRFRENLVFTWHGLHVTNMLNDFQVPVILFNFFINLSSFY